jgi:polyisoprenoid-binding protein YceI
MAHGVEGQDKPLRARGAVHVFTFKEGVLSSVAHDLRLSFGRFEIVLDGEAVEASFDLRELSVDGAVEGGTLRPYRADERAKVETSVQREVLDTRRFPTATFRGRAIKELDGYAVEGELELKGRKEPLAFRVTDDAGTYRAAFELEPSRWGIAPYKAMLGAIRLKDRVRIELELVAA